MRNLVPIFRPSSQSYINNSAVLKYDTLGLVIPVLLSSRPGLDLEDPRGHLMKVLALALDCLGLGLGLDTSGLGLGL